MKHHRRDVPRYLAGHAPLRGGGERKGGGGGREAAGYACSTRGLELLIRGERDDGIFYDDTQSTTPRTGHTVVVPTSIDMVSLLGPGDEHLAMLERAFEASSMCVATGSRSRATPARSRSPSGSSTSSSRSSGPARALDPDRRAGSRCSARRRRSDRPTSCR